MKKILVGIFAAVMCLGVSAPAHAAFDDDTDGDGWPQYLENNTWYNNAFPGYWSTYEEKWLHQAYPVTCTDDENLPAWKVIWVTETGTQADSAKYPDTQIGAVRSMLREVTSAFPASAGITRLTAGGLETNRAPRWDTFEQADGTCHPSIAKVSVPDGTLDDYAFGPGGVVEWLRDNGYDAANRKYLVFVQKTGFAELNNFAGASESPGIGSPTITGPSSPNNAQSFSLIAVENDPVGWMDGMYAATTVHEMTHAMGAMDPAMPHFNQVNPAHPSDCFDVLCYDPGGQGNLGQSYLTACGRVTSQALVANYDAARQTYRLDCNDDDYYAAPDQVSGTYLTNHWNAYNSAFLWGAPLYTTPPQKPSSMNVSVD